MATASPTDELIRYIRSMRPVLDRPEGRVQIRATWKDGRISVTSSDKPSKERG